jgi:phosphotransferase system  glucose/maltose/N-acetylglucosamine-specific IIC component
MINQVGHIGWLGWIVFATVVGSLLLTVLAAVLAKPWKPKVALLVLGTMFTVAIAFVLTFWVGGRIFSAFVP